MNLLCFGPPLVSPCPFPGIGSLGPLWSPAPVILDSWMVCPWAAGLPATPHVLLAVVLAISSLSYDRRQTLRVPATLQSSQHSLRTGL